MRRNQDEVFGFINALSMSQPRCSNKNLNEHQKQSTSLIQPTGARAANGASWQDHTKTPTEESISHLSFFNLINSTDLGLSPPKPSCAAPHPF